MSPRTCEFWVAIGARHVGHVELLASQVRIHSVQNLWLHSSTWIADRSISPRQITHSSSSISPVSPSSPLHHHSPLEKSPLASVFFHRNQSTGVAKVGQSGLCASCPLLLEVELCHWRLSTCWGNRWLYLLSHQCSKLSESCFQTSSSARCPSWRSFWNMIESESPCPENVSTSSHSCVSMFRVPLGIIPTNTLLMLSRADPPNYHQVSSLPLHLKLLPLRMMVTKMTMIAISLARHSGTLLLIGTAKSVHCRGWCSMHFDPLRLH